MSDRPQRIEDVVAGAVDCDFHPHFKRGIEDLAPYLGDAWRRRVNVGSESWAKGLPGAEFRFPFTSYTNPGGSMRLDTVQDDGLPPASDPAVVVEQLLDRFDLGASILIGGHVLGLSGLADADLAAAIAAAYNEWMADVWLDADPRFKGSILVGPRDPLKAAAEIERWAGDERMVQVFMPNMPLAAGKRHFYPIYEAAERHGLPIALHPGGEAAGVNGVLVALDAPSYYIEWHSRLGGVYQAHVTSLICEGVFQRFPGLRVAIVEGGFAWLPDLIWRLDKNWRGLREEVPWLDRLPSEVIFDHLRVTSQPLYEPDDRGHLLAMLEMMRADRMLMFSCDYPHWDADDPIAAWTRMPPELVRRVMHDNPRELYRRLAPATAASR